MPYYDKDSLEKCPKLLEYFKKGILDTSKNISHCLLFWGPDINLQCALALEIARLLNCSKDKSPDCDCLNCRWIKEQSYTPDKSHPAVKIYTRLDFKEASSSSDEDDENSTKGKKNITIEQAKAIIGELAVSSDYHRVYIFCDRDADGNLLPLNLINFPEATSNALLKTFEEPPKNTTFIFLTKDPSDIISTVVSRSQAFFVPSVLENNQDFSLVEDIISNYWTFDRNSVLEFQQKILNLAQENDPMDVFTQMQNYMLAVMKANGQNKHLFYKMLEDMKYVEDAKVQISLSRPMLLPIAVENLCFKIML
ncbi:hypothetical protein IKR55_03030 [bacterium]|nr:hypothetical protein [bacterium]